MSALFARIVAYFTGSGHGGGLWWSTLVITKKELVSLRRNRMFFRGVVVMQLIQVALMGFIDTTTRDLPLVIVDQDMTTYSRELVASCRNTTIFEVKFVTHDPTEARSLIRSGVAKAGVIIPPDFHEKRASGKPATVLALVDGSDSASSQQALSTVNGLAAQLGAQDGHGNYVVPKPLVEARGLLLYNPQGRTPNFLLPALLAMMLATLMMPVTMAFVREKDAGTLERLLMTPLHYTGLMLGKAIPVLLVGLLDAAVLLAAMRWVFQVHIQGSLVLIFFAVTLYLLTIVAMGVYYGAISSNGMEAAQKAGYIALPNMLLSGYLFPLSGVPKLLLPLAYTLPATHMVEIMRALILRDASLRDVLPHVLYLALVPAVVIWFALRKFRESIGKM